VTPLQALVTLPVLLPMLGAATSVVVSRRASAQRVIGVVTLTLVCVVAAVLLVAADANGPVVAELGGWSAPMGIVLVADRMSALLLLISTVVTLAVLVYAIDQRISDYGRETASTTFHPIFLLLSTGVSLAYLTGDLFTLFVAFEIMLASSYVLITRRTSASRIRSGMTYVIVSLTSSLLFLTAVGLVYAATGTVNLADLAGRMGALPEGLRAVLALVLIVVFGIKAAIVPLHFWLPDSYPNAPAPVTALFAGLLTKVGIYALLRTQTLVFPQDSPSTLLLVIAAVTMVVGALGAVAQDDLNRLLSFLLVSHIGFMVFGLAPAHPRRHRRDRALRRPPHHGPGDVVPGQRAHHPADRDGVDLPDGWAGPAGTAPGRAVRDPRDHPRRAATHLGVRREARAAAGRCGRGPRRGAGRRRRRAGEPC
jgi:multicomponent Na+:H+ antiporter subunit D